MTETELQGSPRTQDHTEVTQLPYPMREFAYRSAIENRKTREWGEQFGVCDRTIRNWKHHPAVVSHVEKVREEQRAELKANALQMERLAYSRLYEILTQNLMKSNLKEVLRAAMVVLGVNDTIATARADAKRYFGE